MVAIAVGSRVCQKRVSDIINFNTFVMNIALKIIWKWEYQIKFVNLSVFELIEISSLPNISMLLYYLLP